MAVPRGLVARSTRHEPVPLARDEPLWNSGLTAQAEKGGGIRAGVGCVPLRVAVGARPKGRRMSNQGAVDSVAAGALGDEARRWSARRAQPRDTTLVTRAGAVIAAALVLFHAGGAMAQVDPVPAGALAHWTFDRAGSDASGNGRNLDLTGSPRFTDARCGEAIVLDGTQWAERPVDDQAFDFAGGNFTISAWINVDDATRPEQMIVSKWTSGAELFGWYLRYLGGGAFLFTDGTGAGGTGFGFIGTGSVVSGAWHHVLVQRNGTGFTMYLDSVVIGSATSSYAFRDHAVPLHIGQRSGVDTTTQTFRGKMGDVAIWDRALTAEERQQVAALCRDGADPTPPAETSLQADPVVPSLFQLRARLTDRQSGAPLGGHVITMSTAAGKVCQATTNADGVAICNSLPAALSILVENGYTAAFPGSSDLGPSSARATLLASGATPAPTPRRQPVPDVTPRPAGPPRLPPTVSSPPSGAALPATGSDDHAMLLGLALLLGGGGLFRVTRRTRLN